MIRILKRTHHDQTHSAGQAAHNVIIQKLANHMKLEHECQESEVAIYHCLELFVRS